MKTRGNGSASAATWSDRVFLPLLRTRGDCFSLKLVYAPGGKLESYILEE